MLKMEIVPTNQECTIVIAKFGIAKKSDSAKYIEKVVSEVLECTFSNDASLTWDGSYIGDPKDKYEYLCRIYIARSMDLKELGTIAKVMVHIHTYLEASYENHNRLMNAAKDARNMHLMPNKEENEAED